MAATDSRDRVRKPLRIAVVGTGISGLLAARLLNEDHDVTVLEAGERIGGHTNTVDVEVGGERHSVDTGFIVYNTRTYPSFTRLLSLLGVRTHESDMSFSVACERSGLEYATASLRALFAQRRNLLRPRFHRMLRDVARFNRDARALLAATPAAGHDAPVDASMVESERSRACGAAFDRTQGVDLARFANATLGELAEARAYSREFLDRYLVPMGAAIWSAAPSRFLEFPALTFARFFHNHGLLEATGQPPWRVVTGGSSRYVEALVEPFAERIRTGCAVVGVRRGASARHAGRAQHGRHLSGDRAAGDHGFGMRTAAARSSQSPTIEVRTADGRRENFDEIVFACHSDQALAVLEDASAAERRVLGAIAYQRNEVVLHTDRSLMPARAAAWASWNYRVLRDSNECAAVTYDMNRLQGLRSREPLLVTLNCTGRIDPARVLASFAYDHPVFTLDAIRAQAARAEIDGVRHTHFCGAYWGYGFHEDGVNSALVVTRRFGKDLDGWKAVYTKAA